MRPNVFLAGLGVVALLGAATTADARPVKPHRKATTSVKPVASAQPPAPVYPVIKRHKCIVGCG